MKASKEVLTHPQHPSCIRCGGSGEVSSAMSKLQMEKTPSGK